METKTTNVTPLELLLIEDNPADVTMVKELLKRSQLSCKLNVARDGVEATEYLFEKVKSKKAPCPDLIFLDLNLPKKDGRVVLREFKESSEFGHIPILVLTTSNAPEDIFKCYELHASCYITKPGDLERFNAVMKAIQDFWFITAELPGSKINA